jgi:hypothetical protein
MKTKLLKNMISAFICLSLGGTAAAMERGETISYGCNEVVAIGRVKTLNYTDLTTEDDLLGRGRFSTQITIKRLLRGDEPRRVVPASRIAHGQLREDHDFLLVLTPAEDQEYVLRTGSLWQEPRPVLAESCR